MTSVPNPGSPEAIAQGCECAQIDNCHGRFPPVPPGTWGCPDGGWYITLGCPVHDPVPRQQVERWQDASREHFAAQSAVLADATVPGQEAPGG